MKIPSLIVGLCCFVLPGCQYDPYASDDTTNQPALKDVVGTYYFEKQTIRGGDDVISESKPIIRLNADGTYQATNIPDLTDRGDDADKKRINAQGRWEITTIGGVSRGWGAVKSIWGISLTSITQTLSAIGFMGEAPPYKLLVTYGDPDEGAVMIFARK